MKSDRVSLLSVEQVGSKHQLLACASLLNYQLLHQNKCKIPILLALKYKQQKYTLQYFRCHWRRGPVCVYKPQRTNAAGFTFKLLDCSFVFRLLESLSINLKKTDASFKGITLQKMLKKLTFFCGFMVNKIVITPSNSKVMEVPIQQKVTKYMYSNGVLKCNFEVLVLYLSISTFYIPHFRGKFFTFYSTTFI